MASRSDPLPREGALLALDPGAKRVGVAVCDPTQLVARPLATAPRALKRLIPLLRGWVAEHAAVGLVVGLPLLESGARGQAAQSAEALALQLRRHLPDLPLTLWDERWSSAEADARRAVANRTERGLGRDAAAAAVILQGYLDGRGR